MTQIATAALALVSVMLVVFGCVLVYRTFEPKMQPVPLTTRICQIDPSLEECHQQPAVTTFTMIRTR